MKEEEEKKRRRRTFNSSQQLKTILVGTAGAEMNTARASGFKTIPSTRLHRPSSKAAINVAFLPVVADTGVRQSLPLLCIAFSESNPPTS